MSLRWLNGPFHVEKNCRKICCSVSDSSASRLRVDPRIREGLECEAEGLSFAKEVPHSRRIGVVKLRVRERRAAFAMGWEAELSRLRGWRRVREKGILFNLNLNLTNARL